MRLVEIKILAGTPPADKSDAVPVLIAPALSGGSYGFLIADGFEMG
jgi:hypothetical protein